MVRTHIKWDEVREGLPKWGKVDPCRSRCRQASRVEELWAKATKVPQRQHHKYQDISVLAPEFGHSHKHLDRRGEAPHCRQHRISLSTRIYPRAIHSSLSIRATSSQNRLSQQFIVNYVATQNVERVSVGGLGEWGLHSLRCPHCWCCSFQAAMAPICSCSGICIWRLQDHN